MNKYTIARPRCRVDLAPFFSGRLRRGHRLAFDVRTRRVQLSDMSQPFLFALEMTTAVLATKGQLSSVRLEMNFQRRRTAVELVALGAPVLNGRRARHPSPRIS